jgi:hypothetical protein
LLDLAVVHVQDSADLYWNFRCSGLCSFRLCLLVHRFLPDAPALIALFKLGQCQRTDPNTQLKVLSLIDEHIIKLREAHGLAPIDDGLTDEDLTAFQQLREMLNLVLIALQNRPAPCSPPGSTDFNTSRPHSGISNVPPLVYLNRLSARGTQRDGTLELPEELLR